MRIFVCIISGRNVSLRWRQAKRLIPAWRACPCGREYNSVSRTQLLGTPHPWDVGEGRASYLDAATVEPGMLAEGAQHGGLGGPVLHQFHEDNVRGILLLKHLHGLLRVVLPAEWAEGRDGKYEQGQGLQEATHSSGRGFPKCWRGHCLPGMLDTCPSCYSFSPSMSPTQKHETPKGLSMVSADVSIKTPGFPSQGSGSPPTTPDS